MKTKKLFTTLLLLVLTLGKCYPQGAANIWYFGTKAGLDFSSGSPVAVTNSAMTQHEGSASICGKNGNLKFYTDGISVWDNSHQQMPNGSGLLGHSSSTQSALILPFIGDTSKYYLFTAQCWIAAGGVNYSVVDMKLPGNGTTANPRGDVVSKNTSLVPLAPEKVCYARHENCTDWWIITHGMSAGNTTFYAFLVTAAGVNTTPVTTSIGAAVSTATWAKISNITASWDGKMVVHVMWDQAPEILDFDNATGVFSNLRTLGTVNQGYGCCFSPNDSLIYVSQAFGGANVYQFDRYASNIGASQTTVATSSNSTGSIQTGPDGKIYVVRSYSTFCGVINSPNKKGVSCNYIDNGVSLGGRANDLGLPYFYLPKIIPCTVDFTYNSPCKGDTAYFSITDTAGLKAISWDFGEPSSGASNHSSLLFPKHLYKDSGHYKVSLIYTLNGNIDTVLHTVQVYGLPYVFLGKDTGLCTGATITLNAKNTGSTYLWHDGSTNQTFDVTQPAIYWVEVTTPAGCKNRDTISITDSKFIKLGPDTGLCPGDSILLNAFLVNCTYKWQDNSVKQTFNVKTPGLYWVELTNNFNCKSKDSIVITGYTLPTANLGNDTLICPSSTLTLNAFLPGCTYKWQDKPGAAELVVTKAGPYWVEVKNSTNCRASDTIEITYSFVPLPILGNDATLCDDETLTLDAGQRDCQYLWQDGSINPTYLVTQSGRYSVLVTNNCGEAFDSLNVKFNNCHGCVFIPNAFTPDANGVNDLFRPIFKCPVNEFDMKIFSRWGELVYETKNPDKGWNGTYRHMPSTVGAYVWTITYSGTLNDLPIRETLKGNVTLLR